MKPHGTFSGKQKKQILQARRKRMEKKKSEKVENGEERGSEAPQVAVEIQVSKNASNNQRGVQMIREIYGLRTVFAREPDDVVQQRRLRAQTERLTVFPARSLWEHEDLMPAHTFGMPIRPKWDKFTTKQQLEAAETSAFAAWIKGVYAEADRVTAADPSLELNFFEHNIDVWRQLWRSVEMSDVLLICSDVRWPLFTFPYALVSYAKSVGKPVVVALTKTDLVAPEVALAWEDYFGKVFPELSVAKTNAFPVVQADGGQRVKAKKDQRVKALKSNPLSKDAILGACKEALGWTGPTDDCSFFTMAAVGAPNAGKSAVINLLVEAHKVAVSATPGKTKHFQTLFVSPECRLLDSPGLLFPSAGKCCRLLQVLVGNYPVSQLREPFSALAFLAQRLNLPKAYGLRYPYDPDEMPCPEQSNHQWTAFELAEALALKRGYTLKGGSLDVYRAGKSVLAEALRGILKGKRNKDRSVR